MFFDWLRIEAKEHITYIKIMGYLYRIHEVSLPLIYGLGLQLKFDFTLLFVSKIRKVLLTNFLLFWQHDDLKLKIVDIKL